MRKNPHSYVLVGLLSVLSKVVYEVEDIALGEKYLKLKSLKDKSMKGAKITYP